MPNLAGKSLLDTRDGHHMHMKALSATDAGDSQASPAPTLRPHWIDGVGVALAPGPDRLAILRVSAQGGKCGSRSGSDRDKYINLQTEQILARRRQFGGKLYLEFGGKLFDDMHASRVLPGFTPTTRS